MRIGGDHNVGVRFRNIEQRFLCSSQCRNDLIDLFPQPKPQICRYLIVTTAACMELAAEIANDFDQARLEERMHVFSRLLEVVRFTLPTLENLLQPRMDLLSFCPG